MAQLVDAAGRPYGQALAESRFDGIIRYLSPGGASLPGKLLLPDEAQSYLDAGKTLVSNWETYAARMNEGYDAGYDDVRMAWQRHKECGGPDNAVIYFSADWDVAPGEQDNVNSYLQACIDYLGVHSVGVYGGYYTVKRVHEWNPDVYLWQTLAWSGGQEYEHIHLLQLIGYVWVGSIQCDTNDIRQDEYGQWNTHLGKENIMALIKSLVDGTEHTPEEMIAFIDYHSWRADQIITARAKLDGIKTDDESLKLVNPPTV
jgi:hypothetical protein